MRWKPIKDFEGYYEVSDTGLVRSVDRTVYDKKHRPKKLKGKLMKQTKSYNNIRECDGYSVVNLRKNSRANVIGVHRLVAETFIDNPDNLPTVNHKDGNKQNNNIGNLEWATYADNNIHALENKLRSPRGNRIVQMSEDGKFISYYNSVCEASRETGIGRSSISHCVNNRINRAGGYIWMKIEKCNDYLNDESTTEDELLLEAQEREFLEDIVCTGGNI